MTRSYRVIINRSDQKTNRFETCSRTDQKIEVIRCYAIFFPALHVTTRIGLDGHIVVIHANTVWRSSRLWRWGQAHGGGSCCCCGDAPGDEIQNISALAQMANRLAQRHRVRRLAHDRRLRALSDGLRTRQDQNIAVQWVYCYYLFIYLFEKIMGHIHSKNHIVRNDSTGRPIRKLTHCEYLLK